MDNRYLNRKLPILILYNINSTWSQGEITEARQVILEISSTMLAEGHSVAEACLEDGDLAGLLRPYPPQDYIVFNFCEEIPGIPRSYDLIAQTLEELGYTFTGADSNALALSQDKRRVKQFLAARGIATPQWQIFTEASSDGWRTYPAIVKPALEHCSLGLSRESVVCSPAELSSRIAYVIDSFNGPALVEEFIDGREFAVIVVGNGDLHVLPVAEEDYAALEDMKDRLLTYESKFDPQSRLFNLIKLRVPAVLSEEEQMLLAQAARECYRLAACRDYARLDFRLRDGIFYILDINPNADISPGFSAALAAESAGLSYGKLLSFVVNLASQRHPLFRIPVKDDLSIGPAQSRQQLSLT